MSQAVCSSCGAPDDGQLVLCTYCHAPLSAEILASAIPCPQCRTPNRWGREQCCHCRAWIVVQCVFCGAHSPHNQIACLSCHEPFAGAMERKQARAQQLASQQTAETVNEVVQVVGAVAPILEVFAEIELSKR